MAKKRQHAPSPHPIFDEPVFGEGVVTPDPASFSTSHPSDSAEYTALGNLLRKSVVGFDPSRIAPDQLYSLETALGRSGPDVVQTITSNGQVVFHAFGDSGASNVRKYRDELRVFDQIAEDVHTSTGADRPSFLFHLGDVIYNFGESRYYYDQFYEPNRAYPGPIFAIPGNHDSFVIPDTPASDTPLTTFRRNFCSETPVVTSEAGSLHRTAMTQPGVYFALDVPFARILGLFSNALEDPGVLSSQGGTWPAVPDLQLEFLTAQLQRIRSEKYQGAVLVAVHHPPFTYAPSPKTGGASGNHRSNTLMLKDIDQICARVGVYPHAVLAAHAHNYQRYTRTVSLGGKDLDVPFVVCGSGGHNIEALTRPAHGVKPPVPAFGSDVSYLDPKLGIAAKGLLLEKYNDQDYGYLRITADANQLRIGFHIANGTTPLPQSRFDLVTVNLADHTMVAN